MGFFLNMETINSSFNDYFILFWVVIVATCLSILLLSISLIFVFQESDVEKISAYECGFQPFDDARNKFDVKYYLVAILFILFDLELMFLVPWAITLRQLGSLGYFSMLIFIIVLTVGFYYEWLKGALEWD